MLSLAPLSSPSRGRCSSSDSATQPRSEQREERDAQHQNEFSLGHRQHAPFIPQQIYAFKMFMKSEAEAETYWIGLGGNWVDSRGRMAAAVRTLSLWSEGGFEVSSLWQTPPVGPSQPDFCNAAVRMRWRNGPEFLLECLLRLESYHGRTREKRWGPRSLDLDILDYDGIFHSQSNLVIPHPELKNRAFALLPLLEVSPRSNADFERALASVEAGGVCKIADSRWWKALP